jgi:hypothetical protein
LQVGKYFFQVFHDEMYGYFYFSARDELLKPRHMRLKGSSCISIFLHLTL